MEITAKDRLKLLDSLNQMKQMASDDPIFFIETFIKMYNPEMNPTEIPFKMFPFQKRLVRQINHAIENGEDIFIDKSRKMGVTYTILSVFLWRWLFIPGQTLYVGSRKEDYVDNRRGGITGNKEESLFGKLDYMLSRIERDAAFILPDNFNRTRHFTYMSLINPVNGNSISGESANTDFSRGSRKTAILLDEFAFWDFGSQAWGATGDTTNCRIIATTPGHKPSKAKRLRFGQDKEKIKIITLTYDLDPRKNKKWLEKERSRRSAEDFNREIMVNWEVSITGRVYPEIENAAYGDFPFIVNQQLYCSWDFGLDGTAILFWQINPANGKPRLIDSYVNQDQVIQFYFPLFGRPIDSKFIYTDNDRKAISDISIYPKAIHYGDSDVNKKSFIKTTTTSLELNEIGICVTSITPNHFVERRDITKIYLAKGIEINANSRNEYAFEAFKMYRYPSRDESSQATTPIVKPVHDWCLAGDTKIRTLSGWREIKDLVGSSFYVWSYSQQHKRLILTKASKCWLVGKKKTLEVILDNGDSIRCTPDHRIMLRDGSYIEAGNLSRGDSLMPFYETDKFGENHKVSGVIYDDKEVDVYDIEVPETQNFVANGVVVHNCSHPSTALEYFFLNYHKRKKTTQETPSWASKKKWGVSRVPRLLGLGR